MESPLLDFVSTVYPFSGAPYAFWQESSQAVADTITDENAQTIFQILVVFLAAKILAEIAERIHQPAVAGELLAGILVGPAVLNWVTPNEFLTALAELGVIFLLFRVGLELDDFELNRLGPTALGVAVLGVIVPFVAGWGIMRALDSPNIEAAFLGAAMVATSVGITARVLAGKGLLNHQASKIILAAAVIDDILGLTVLAIVSAMAEGSVNIPELVATALLALGFTYVVAQWGQQAMERVVPPMSRQFTAGGGQFSLSLILVFLLSMAAAFAGVAAIIGAFLAGMALASSTGPRVEVMVAGATELLVPFFLVGIGLNLNLDVFQDRTLLLMAIGLLILAGLTKFIGCALPAWKLGWTDASRIGVGMIPRGEVGLVVAQFGLRLEVISDSIYAMVVFMSIGTTLLAPPLLALVYKGATEEETAKALPRVG